MSLLCGMAAIGYILGESFSYHMGVCVLTLYVAENLSKHYVVVRSIGIAVCLLIAVVDTFVETSTLMNLPIVVPIQCLCALYMFLQIPDLVMELPTEVVKNVESFLLTSVPTLVTVSVAVATNNIFSKFPITSAFMFFLMSCVHHIFLYEASVVSVTSSKVNVYYSPTSRKIHRALFHVGPAIVYLFNADVHYTHHSLVLCLVGPIAYVLEREGNRKLSILRFGVCAVAVWTLLLFHGGMSLQTSMLTTFCITFANSEWLRYREVSTIVPIVSTRQFHYSDALAVFSYVLSGLLIGIPASAVLLVVAPSVLYLRTQKHFVLLISCMFIFFIWEHAHVMNFAYVVASKIGIQNARFQEQFVRNISILTCFAIVSIFCLRELFTVPTYPVKIRTTTRKILAISSLAFALGLLVSMCCSLSSITLVLNIVVFDASFLTVLCSNPSIRTVSTLVLLCVEPMLLFWRQENDFLLFTHALLCFLVSRYLKENYYKLRNIWSFSSFVVLLVLSTRYLLRSVAIFVSSICLITFRLQNEDENTRLTAPSFFCACFLCILTLCDIVMTTNSFVLRSSWFFATAAHILTWISVLDPSHHLAIRHITVLPLHVLGLVLARTLSSVSYSTLGVVWVLFQSTISYKRWREGQLFL